MDSVLYLVERLSEVERARSAAPRSSVRGLTSAAGCARIVLEWVRTCCICRSR